MKLFGIFDTVGSIVDKVKEVYEDRCPVPFAVNIEWPLAEPPKYLSWTEQTSTDERGSLKTFPCNRWYWRMWVDSRGVGPNKNPAYQGFNGERYENIDTGEIFWTLFTDSAYTNAEEWKAHAEAAGYKFAPPPPGAVADHGIEVGYDTPVPPGTETVKVKVPWGEHQVVVPPGTGEKVADELKKQGAETGEVNQTPGGTVKIAGLPWWGWALAGGAILTAIIAVKTRKPGKQAKGTYQRGVKRGKRR